jgi:acetyltransferase-like isoleucine patch superfamily enzyme
MKFFQIIIHWFRFRLYYYLPFLRPPHIRFKGKIKFDLFSFIAFNQQSEVEIGLGLKLKKSRVYLIDSKVKLGDQGRISYSILLVQESELHWSDHFQMKQMVANITESSKFEAGSYLMLDGGRSSKSGLYIRASQLSWGENVNHFAQTHCMRSSFIIGNHVFINEGTQIRCAHSIHMGNHIFISYDCLIFDTNTHSVEAAERREEIRAGYPNATKQTDIGQTKIKTGPISIGDDVWIGTRAVIFKGTQLDSEVIVGAAAVLSGTKAAKGSTVFGNPAQVKPAS